MGSGSHNVQMRHVYGGTVPTFSACIHVDGKTGKLCGKPTKDGRQRCPQCSTHLITFTDRVPETTQAHEKHSWRKPMKL